MYRHKLVMLVVFMVLVDNLGAKIGTDLGSKPDSKLDAKSSLQGDGIFGDNGVPRLLKLKLFTKNHDIGRKLLILHILRKPKDDCNGIPDEDCDNYYGGTNKILCATFLFLTCLLSQ